MGPVIVQLQGAGERTPNAMSHAFELDWIDEHVGDNPYGVDIVIPGKYEGQGELDAEKLEPERCVFVGDARSDYEGAQENGVPFIARVTSDNEAVFADLEVVRIPDLCRLEEAIAEVLRG